MKKSKYFSKPRSLEVEDREVLSRLVELRDAIRAGIVKAAEDLRTVSMRPCSVDASGEAKIEALANVVRDLRLMEKSIEDRGQEFARISVNIELSGGVQ